MALLFSTLKSHAQHALGGGTPASQLTLNGIVNGAAQWFVSHHPWNFRIRPPVTLSFTADQEYVALPADFGEMVAVEMTRGLLARFTFTDPQTLAALRANSVPAQQSYFRGVIVQPGPATTGAAVQARRIELYPTPSVTQADVMTMVYRANWTDLDTDGHFAYVPQYAENGLIAAVRAFAQGYEEDSAADVSQRLASLENGPLLMPAKFTDGLQQHNYGVMGGGAIEGMYEYADWRAASVSPVPDP